MRQHRWLATSVGLALLFTTAASTTYAWSDESVDSVSLQGNWCNWFPFLPWCSPPKPNPGPGPSPKLAATPELDSLVLFGFGLSGVGGYALTRFRARRRGN